MSFKNLCTTLDKVAEDEPIFVLRAQDELAPNVIEIWASMAQANGASQAKTEEALRCADAMRAWPTRKMPD